MSFIQKIILDLNLIAIFSDLEYNIIDATKLNNYSSAKNLSCTDSGTVVVASIATMTTLRRV
jgi:hypothetical protein